MFLYLYIQKYIDGVCRQSSIPRRNDSFLYAHNIIGFSRVFPLFYYTYLSKISIKEEVNQEPKPAYSRWNILNGES